MLTNSGQELLQEFLSYPDDIEDNVHCIPVGPGILDVGSQVSAAVIMQLF
jgi:hypothetical protein